ncbi:MAG: glycosyltransferase [Anaerolineales bacterium]|nr:glycosyltransferase [Anaerolineales bacterium]
MKHELTVAVFAADWWEHVCPVVRVTGPAQAGGARILQGNRWENGAMITTPDVIRDADLVLVQRNFPAHLDAFAQIVDLTRTLKKPLVYELDDLLTELPPEHPDVAYYRKTRPAILSAIAIADAVVGSTPAICAYLKNWNERVFHFPNYLNDTLWPLTPPRPAPEPKDRLVLGYMGGHSHLADLEMLTPVLERLMRKYWGYLTLRFWGAPPPAALRAWTHVEHLNPGLVSYAGFAEYFRQQHADFFIAPLQNNLFNRAKSHLKFLEYSGMGLPGVYSHLPTYANVVEDGANGFLADSAEAWETRLTALIEQPETRARLGQAAYQTVSDHWRLSRHADAWVTHLRQVAATGPVAHPARVWQTVRQTSQWYAEIETLTATRETALATTQAQLTATQGEVARLQAEVTRLDETLKFETSRKGWQILEKIRSFSIRLFPYKSFRWRIWMTLLNAAYNYRTGGLKGLILNASNLDPKPHLPHLELTLGTGQLCPTPAITVIGQTGHFTPHFDETHIQAWVQRQTIAGQVAVVTWNTRTGQACLTHGPCWQADDLPALLDNLPGRYVCFASPDLLEQPEIYLEGNLLALETEALDFTVNLNGAVEWAYPHLQNGRLPGDATMPLARIVARKEIITPDGALKPRADTPSTDRVAGRIIAHTRSTSAGDAALPFGTVLHGHLHLFEKRFVLRADPATEFKGVPLTIRPVTQMLVPAPVADPRPTVLVLISFLAVGGAEFLLYNVLRKLQSQFRFVIMTVEGMLPSQGTTTDLFRSVTPYVYITPDYLEMKLNFSMLEYLHTRFSPVTIYIPNGSNWLFDRIEQLRARFAEVRFINQVYDHAVGWIFRYNETFAKAVDIHIAPNQNIAQAYVERGVRMDQIAFIEHGISSEELNPQVYDAEKIAALKTQLNLPLDKKIIAFVARLYPQKRPMDFVELARRFQNDPSVYFLMVGDGVLREKVDAQIKRSHLQNFRRLDFYKPIKDIYALLDVLVLPSKYEAMPMVVAETLAMGKPVVVTDVGNNRDVVEMTGGGVVVPAIGNVAALQVAVQKVLANPPDPEKLRTAILARFDIQWIAEKHAQIFLPK